MVFGRSSRQEQGRCGQGTGLSAGTPSCRPAVLPSRRAVRPFSSVRFLGACRSGVSLGGGRTSGRGNFGRLHSGGLRLFAGRSLVRRLTGWRSGSARPCGERLLRLRAGLAVPLGGAEVAAAVGCRRHAVLLLEELDEVRRVGEGALHAYLRDGLRGRDEQQPRVHQPLADVPLVGRHLEVAPELLLERGERAVGQPRQLLDGDILEDVVVDRLFEVLLGRVDVAQQLALDAAVLVRGDEVNQLRHLDALGGLVLQEALVAQVVVRVDEKVAQRAPCGHGDVGAVVAVFARMVVRDVESVGDVQVEQDALQVGGRVVEEHLLEGLAVFGDVLHVVVAEPQVEDVAAVEGLAFVAVVDILRAAQDIAYGVA